MLEIVRIYTHSSLRNFTYLIRQPDTEETLCLDPFDSSQVSAVLKEKNWSLEYIVNTHEHWDHTAGNEGLVQEFKSIVLTHPQGMETVPSASRSLHSGERILSDREGNSYLEVLDTPGHTFAHICLVQIENKVPVGVFTGDTIFNCGVGNCKNGGDPSTLYQTVSRIFYQFPDGVKLYPGHDYFQNNLKFSLAVDPANSAAHAALKKVNSLKSDAEFWTTNFAEERTFNPFFLCSKPSASLLSGIRNKSAQPNLPEDERTLFLTLRSLRDKW
ncbi:putative hydroxyacylglutathione hydrolase [Leptospira inadai serovar Lyme str. 10]|uniref:hydroxyacylglutathione hydrolase n=2 Tax=Leptospira inadai serovar Lyme TaxID=293084 RepID=V6HBL6_9LEPT|nr:hydroxyacylglutathione hydrolase family protein [Leptospira inadai]EQA37071.1 putative hydroxyacylglutathione hydrolase [Leptospira inadai serovar Lyme str. 10]PNV76583.1 hydroxyacylglutathione hydrolase [Leptospira inadai serovar Lyme]